MIAGLAELFGCEDEETEDMFQCEHWDLPDDPELAYSFNVANGGYLVLNASDLFSEPAFVWNSLKRTMRTGETAG